MFVFSSILIQLQIYAESESEALCGDAYCMSITMVVQENALWRCILHEHNHGRPELIVKSFFVVCSTFNFNKKVAWSEGFTTIY